MARRGWNDLAFEVVDAEGEREIKCGNGESENERECVYFTLVGSLILEPLSRRQGLISMSTPLTHT